MQPADLIIKARWLISMDHHDQVHENRAVVIREGKIIAIELANRVDSLYEATETCHLPHHALMPGFVNAHTHLPMSLLRGLADDLPLMKWLEEYIWPTERHWVAEDFVRDGARLAMAELIRGGVTCFNEMYFFENQIAEVAHEVGLRGRVAESILDFEMPWSKNGDVCIQKVIDNIQFVKDFPLIEPSVAPHSPYGTSRKHLERALEISEQYKIPIHIHLQETFEEVEQCKLLHHKRPTAYLDEIGLNTPRLQAVHMTQTNSDDILLLKKSGGHVIHCPESNMKLASGSCPVHELLAAGVNVALGTDGAASNNDLDMFGEMRSAAMMAKLVDMNPELLPAAQVLRMATINGAKALGFDHLIGSIRVGKSADVIAVDLERPETMPVYNPISHIVYAASREQVTDVWVAGRQLLKQRALTTIDEEALKANVQSWHQKISKQKRM